MKKLKYLFIHCTATPEGRDWGKKELAISHLGPKPLMGGMFLFMGKKYKNRAAIPSTIIEGTDLRNSTGRGWSKYGYRDMILLSGEVVNITDYDNDVWVEAGEVTNGALGYNEVSAHVVYVGGVSANGKLAKDTRNSAQRAALEVYVKGVISKHPDIIVIGHNQTANKACPSFSVPKWLRSIGLPEKHVALVDPFLYSKNFAA